MDNGAMENFYFRLKIDVFYGKQFEAVEVFILALNNYNHYCSYESISLNLKGMCPVYYQTHAQAR